MKRCRLLATLSLPVAGALFSACTTRTPQLKVGAALPDPPFEFFTATGATGFDVVLMQRIAQRLGREWQLVPYTGADFNGIFNGLDPGPMIA